VKRALEKREQKIFENDKTAIFVRGGHTSEVVTQFLSELVFSLRYRCFPCLLNVCCIVYTVIYSYTKWCHSTFVLASFNYFHLKS